MREKTMKYFDGPTIDEEEYRLVKDALDQGNISQGKYVKKFQDNLGEYIGTKYSLAICNGTSALHLAIESLGIGKGDEVIVPSHTFISSVNAIKFTGAQPVFADCELDTYNLDPKKIESLITPQTKAIMPVHLFGLVCDMNQIKEIADKHSLYVIEDAAEALGSNYYGKKAGNLSDVSCFSFYSNKLITTGEGGACLTNNKEIFEKIGLLRCQGKELGSVLKERNLPQFYHSYLGYNYRMTDIQGALGVAQLKKLETFIDKKRKIAAIYNDLLKNTSITSPIEKENCKHTYWQYHIMFPSKEARLQAVKKLDENEIGRREPFYPCHLQPFYNTNDHLPNTMEIFERGEILPNSMTLDEETIKKIVDTIK